ncbi:hypothetical protein HH1059_23270 [Halorhodospira halochloris]|uniref:Pili assembly chaperone N-terminal domain-containing protein n=1 Tax=Halorhodospira halochloris TaxID=1052 RepID=A0A120MZI4_HALHR|nr:hypothetical protein [Halorhodospira halochloris]MBK1651090.1 hypothetical protein [Halorhodospira halochloris]BAU56396.1 hypothetical protein HH1059_23270 [Halorhodospira halochloris]
MKRAASWYSSATIGLALGVTATQVAASIQIAPQRLFFDDQQRSAQVEVFNQSDEVQEYRVVVADVESDAYGRSELIDPVEPAAGEREHHGADLLRHHPRQMTLGPGESQTVRIMSRVPDDVEPGEYRARFAVRTMPSADAPAFAEEELEDDEVAVDIQALFAMTIPVGIQVGEPEGEPQIRGARFEAAEDDEDEDALQVTVARNGDRGIYGSLEVYRPGDDEPILERGRAVISSSMEERVLPFSLDEHDLAPGDELRVVYRAFEDEGEGFGEVGGHVKAERTVVIE